MTGTSTIGIVRLRTGLAALVALLLSASTVSASAAAPGGAVERFIVSGAEDVAAVVRTVEAAGGHVVRELGIIRGVVAELPTAGVAAVRASGAVRSVTPDAEVVVHGVYDGFDAGAYQGSLALINRDVIGATSYWDAGFTGQGIDVAVIDTGVGEVPGLDAGQVLHGPDLSFDSQYPELTHTDGHGHGTHMAGIIAGREAAATGAPTGANSSDFHGVAPGARVLSVKIGDHGGTADVSQAIAAIDWVVQHRDTDGLNVRVLNLSFGYDSAQPFGEDPLAHAAGVAWNEGIVVVAAAGNGGSRSTLSSPAYNPNILAVGATDSMMTATTTDDVVPTWSSCDQSRNPDVVAPGRSVASLRVPNGFVDASFPESRLSAYLSRGSGTSQAAAVVSGAAALILSQRPDATPNDVRSLLTSTASPIRKSAPKKCQGAGVIDLRKALGTAAPAWWGWAPTTTGTGSLEKARGPYHVVDTRLDPSDPNYALTGERDIFGKAWDGSLWGPAATAGSSWTGGTWNGSSWTGSSWTGSSWTGSSWTGSSWTGSSWTGSSWTGSSWTGSSWTGSSWTGSSWTGSSWTGSSWTGSSWTGSSWTGSSWTGSSWTSAGWGDGAVAFSSSSWG